MPAPALVGHEGPPVFRSVWGLSPYGARRTKMTTGTDEPVLPGTVGREMGREESSPPTMGRSCASSVLGIGGERPSMALTEIPDRLERSSPHGAERKSYFASLTN